MRLARSRHIGQLPYATTRSPKTPINSGRMPGSAPSRRDPHVAQIVRDLGCSFERVPTYVCVDIARCIPTTTRWTLRGVPLDGSLMHPGNTQVWELKYGFSLLGGVQYAANLWYQIVGTNDSVEYTIETWSTVNESACKVNGTTKFACTAEGTKLTFK